MLENASDFASNEMQLFESRRRNLNEQLAIFNDRKFQTMLDLEEAKTRLLNLEAEKKLTTRQVEIFTKLFKIVYAYSI